MATPRKRRVTWSHADKPAVLGCLRYLDELHHQVEFRGRVHLLHQHDDVGVFDLPQHRDLVLDEVLLHTHVHALRTFITLAVTSLQNQIYLSSTLDLVDYLQGKLFSRGSGKKVKVHWSHTDPELQSELESSVASTRVTVDGGPPSSFLVSVALWGLAKEGSSLLGLIQGYFCPCVPACQQYFTNKAFTAAGVLLCGHVTPVHLPLHARSDHGEVAVSDDVSNFVTVQDGGSRLVDVTIHCGGRDRGQRSGRQKDFWVNQTNWSEVTFWAQLIS